MINNIFFTADLHFWHDKSFIYAERGYSSVKEMNENLIAKYNSRITSNDTVYLLGDICLGDTNNGIKCVKQLKGKKILIYGNHDKGKRLKVFEETGLFDKILKTETLQYGNKTFILTHKPIMIETDILGNNVYNLHGHTHQKTKWTGDKPFYINVGVDSNDGYPLSLMDLLCIIYEN